MRTKIGILEEVLTGHFRDHHALLARTMLDRVDVFSASIDQITQAIETAVAPFRAAVERLDEITRIGIHAAHELIGEIGVEMTRFPTDRHLPSWAKLSPIEHSSAGSARKARQDAAIPGWPAPWARSCSASHTPTPSSATATAVWPAAQRAIVAVGNSVLRIIWHLLADPDAHYTTSVPATSTPAAIPNASRASSSANSSN